MVEGRYESALLPVFRQDGGWFFPFAPQIVIDEASRPPGPGFNVPAPGEGLTFADYATYGDWQRYRGPAKYVHLYNMPQQIRNVGIPGTGLNAREWFRTWLRDIVHRAYTSRGDRVLAVVMYEYNRSVTGPDILWYELAILIADPVSQPATMFTRGSAHPQQARPFVITIGAALVIIAALVAIVPGAGQMFMAMVGSVGSATAGTVRAASMGPAIILVGAGGALLALAYFLNKNPTFAGPGLEQAKAIGTGTKNLAEEASGLGAIERTAATARSVSGR